MTVTCKTCQGPCQLQPRKLVIAVAGLSCETSTFTHARTELSAFNPLRGQEIINNHKFLREGTTLGDAAEWRGALTAYAIPGGVVTGHAFDKLLTEIVVRLDIMKQDTRIDGLWLDIHGAMHVEGLDDSEGELLTRIRGSIGMDVPVSVSMDLHGNVSRRLVTGSDLLTCYRTAPHEDVKETKERACRNLVNLLYDRHRYNAQFESHAPWPIKAWVPIPILLPGEQTSTRQEPAKSIYAKVEEVESREGIIDASVWVGYAWADEPRSNATVIVTGWTKSAIMGGAEELARMFWGSKKEFDFVAPTGSLNECFSAALESTARPYFISDSGDNPTAGGSGDVTWTFRRLLSLLEHRESESLSNSNFVYASIPSSGAVDKAVKAGLDATVTVTIDAGIDDETSDPITLTGTVFAIKRGDRAAKIEVVLKIAALPVFIILTKLRKPYHYSSDFTELSLDIGDEKQRWVVIVKIGYLEPELYALAKDWMLALTPGGVDQDLQRLGHKLIARPMWPLDKDFAEEPDLTARVVGRPGED